MAKVKAYDSHYTTGLEDLILNVNQVAMGNFAPNDLYMIKYEGEVKGPIAANDLKAFIENNNDYYTKAEVCRLDLFNNNEQKDWSYVYQQPLFQRRKPSLTSLEENELEAFEDLFVLKNGQKLGPYTFAELSKQLKKHDLLFTDYLSFDGGHTWKKMHEIKDLDRRDTESEHLPIKPKTEILNQFELHQGNQEASILKDLAFLSSNKEKTNKNEEKLQAAPSLNSSYTHENTSQFKKAMYFISSFALVFFFSWYLKAKKSHERNINEQISTNESSTPSNKNKRVGNQRVNNKKVPDATQNKAKIEINNQASKKRRIPAPVRRRSFRESNAYKQNEKNMLDDASVNQDQNENYQFDDGNDPVEQDPIRSQLDKETIDPENMAEDRAPAGADYEEDVYADGEDNSAVDRVDDGEY